LDSWNLNLNLNLTAYTHDGMARLSWSEWPVTCRDICPAPGTEPEHGHPSSTNRARRRPTSHHYASASVNTGEVT